jgi:iron only hydrogenase large subunit-like protein
MRRCPTQAIRVVKGKAVISDELCVDCGHCIEACTESAIAISEDNLNGIAQFKHKVLVVPPVLYSQFEPRIHPYVIHLALKGLGFDHVVDVAPYALALERALELYIESYKGRLPLISSQCPCVIRLIQVKYPDLAELIIPLETPRELAAREIKKELQGRLGLAPEQLGAFHVASCPAKMVSIRQPAEKNRSWFDGYISVRGIYPIMLPHVLAINKEFDPSMVPPDFRFSTAPISHSSETGGERAKINGLAVSGLYSVMRILNDIENSKLRNITYIEAHAHMLGCVGGPTNVESPYIARANSLRQGEDYQQPIQLDDEDITRKLKDGYFFMEHPILPRPTAFFDTDLETSIKRMKERERIYQKLPQIDCGCCGSPTCMTFAEDFVRGEVKPTDCYHFSQPRRVEEQET